MYQAGVIICLLMVRDWFLSINFTRKLITNDVKAGRNVTDDLVRVDLLARLAVRNVSRTVLIGCSRSIASNSRD
jgi:hypothetical protein